MFFFLDIFFFFLLKKDSLINSHHVTIIHFFNTLICHYSYTKLKEKGFPTQPARLTGSVLSHVLRDTNAH